MVSNVREQLMRDEGLRLQPYRCGAGRLTIGYGHNLDAKAISRRAAEVMLDDDIADVSAELKAKAPWTAQLDPVRFAVLVNMAFNLGVCGLLGFTVTLALVRLGRYEAAAAAMLDSKWHLQVGTADPNDNDRAERLAVQMRTGEWH